MASIDPQRAHRRFSAHLGWHLVGLSLVTGWLGVLGIMFWPQEQASGARPLSASDLSSLPAQDEFWMGAYHQGRKLGWAHSRLTRMADGVDLIQESRLQVTLAGVAQSVETHLSARLDADQRLERFGFDLKAGPLHMKVEGRTVPAGLELLVDLGAEHGRRVLPMKEPALLDLALPYLLARQDLRPGARFLVPIFDPRTLSNQDQLIEVVGPEALDQAGRLVMATHLRRSSAGLQLDSWLDANGRVLKEQLQGGLELVHEQEQQATRAITGVGADPVDSAGSDWLRMLAPGAFNGKQARTP